MGMIKSSAGSHNMERDTPPRSQPPKSAPDAPAPPKRARLRQDFASQKDLHVDPITRNLRKAFDEVAAEPLPEEFLDLLRQIDESAGGENER